MSDVTYLLMGDIKVYFNVVIFLQFIFFFRILILVKMVNPEYQVQILLASKRKNVEYYFPKHKPMN